jgi:chemotaxis regulatin CheY-phosphate phosphatase CheZ
MDGEAGAGLEQRLREAMRSELGGMFEELRRFVDRRIAELSTEVHATVEMVDFSETNLTQQLQRMHQQLSRVVALPAAATRSSGVELESIVQATEDAANRILGAAEAIRDAATRPDGQSAILAHVNTIFEACAFQDLTSQRIHRSIDQLRALDRMLEHMVEHTVHPGEEGGAAREPIRLTVEIAGSGGGPDLAQDEIDKLMAG